MTHFDATTTPGFQGNVATVGLSQSGLDAQILRGFHRFRRDIKLWRMLEGGHHREFFEVVLQRDPHGILTHVTDEAFCQRLIDERIPVVNFATTDFSTPFADILVDDEAVGCLAAEYAMGLRPASFIGWSGQKRTYEHKRCTAYIQALSAAGHQASWFCMTGNSLVHADGTEEKLVDFESWLKELPKPLVCYSPNDSEAAQVVDHCKAVGFHVPEEVAVLGTDNSELHCDSSLVPLSSVHLPGERMGYLAGQWLAHMMETGQQMNRTELMAPTNVIPRKSTDLCHIEDPIVSKALGFINERPSEIQSMVQLAQLTGVGRRTLERRFRLIMDRSPLEHLFFRRVQIAKDRLLQSADAIEAVAKEIGFSTEASFARQFRKFERCNPSTFRKRHQLSKSAKGH